jgi:hypothetical protein
MALISTKLFPTPLKRFTNSITTHSYKKFQSHFLKFLVKFCINISDENYRNVQVLKLQRDHYVELKLANDMGQSYLI